MENEIPIILRLIESPYLLVEKNFFADGVESIYAQSTSQYSNGATIIASIVA